MFFLEYIKIKIKKTNKVEKLMTKNSSRIIYEKKTLFNFT